jgi:hypothetical protein
MISKLPAVAMIFCTLSYAAAGTTALGTASARGDMRVDGYMVKGDATLFDGTVVETGQASAALRLDKGVEIKLSTSSRGTLHRDRLVLQQGTSELASSNTFQLEANGLRVTPSEPNSRGLVSVSGANTVEVAALTGGFRVTDAHGLLLARIHPGNALSFGVPQAGAPESSSITVVGKLTVDDGHYYLTASETEVVYELRGQNFDKLVGKNVSITGTLDPNAKPAGGASAVIDVSSAKKKGAEGTSTTAKVIIASLMLGGAAGIGYGTYAANQPLSPASR